MINQALPVVEAQARPAIDAQKPVSRDKMPLRDEFQTLVNEYAQEAVAQAIEGDRPVVAVAQEENQVTQEPEAERRKPETAKGVFPGMWQLLLDLLEAVPGARFDSVAVIENAAEAGLAQSVDKPVLSNDDAAAAVRLPAPQSAHNAAAVDARALLDQVTAAIVGASGGKNRLVVRLHPPDMGTVTVKVTRAAGRVAVEIRTSDSRVQGMLARGAGELRDGLKMQGLSVDRFDVLSGENQGSRKGREERRRGPSVAFQIEFDAAGGE